MEDKCKNKKNYKIIKGSFSFRRIDCWLRKRDFCMI